MNLLLRSISIASIFVTLGLGVAPLACVSRVEAPATSPPPSVTPTAEIEPAPLTVSVPAFRGSDRFDDVRTVAELRELESEIVDVVERVRPSVVLLRVNAGRGGVASGTAVIIGKDGLLATCAHVGRSPGRDVTAVLADGTELRGRTLGQRLDGEIDCGLVQLDVEGRELPAAPLGTAEKLAEGDWLIALGYTHGLSDTSRPSLARVGRVLAVDETGLFFDAPIDAGDSGGPSFNLSGEVVGLNSRCGRESWKNLATPIDRLTEQLDSLREQREVPEKVPDAPSDAGPSPPRINARFPADSGDEDKLAVERAVPARAVTARAQGTMVRVYCDRVPVAFGLVIDGSGLAVTKASQLKSGTEIEVETSTRTYFSAREVARDQTTDVALLRFSPERATASGVATAGQQARLRTVTWAVDAPLLPGAIVLTPRDFDERPALGFAAIERRESDPDMTDGPFLGVQTRPATRDERELAAVERAVTVVRVVPGAAAERAGLRQGDIVVAVDGTALDSPEQLRRIIRRHEVGDVLRLETIGSDGGSDGGSEGATTREVTLGRRGDSGATRRGNTATPISQRSTGLGSLLAHDAVTKPEQMGGPVVDLDGRVLGMNIARYDRTATHAIGADRMAEICRRLVEQYQRSLDASEPPATRELVPGPAE